MRRSDDGQWNAVKRILTRNMPCIVLGVVGSLCIVFPIAFSVAGVAWWPFVVAYGGVLVGIALSGRVQP